jgi:hypothetical protein
MNDIAIPYKKVYRRYHDFRNNSMTNVRPRHISFQGYDRSDVTCLHFDSDLVISGSVDSTVNIYETRTGRFRRTLRGHLGGAWAMQYLDGVLVSGSADRTVRVWISKVRNVLTFSVVTHLRFDASRLLCRDYNLMENTFLKIRSLLRGREIRPYVYGLFLRKDRGIFLQHPPPRPRIRTSYASWRDIHNLFEPCPEQATRLLLDHMIIPSEYGEYLLENVVGV